MKNANFNASCDGSTFTPGFRTCQKYFPGPFSSARNPPHIITWYRKFLWRWFIPALRIPLARNLSKYFKMIHFSRHRRDTRDVGEEFQINFYCRKKEILEREVWFVIFDPFPWMKVLLFTLEHSKTRTCAALGPVPGAWIERRSWNSIRYLENSFFQARYQTQPISSAITNWISNEFSSRI